MNSIFTFFSTNPPLRVWLSVLLLVFSGSLHAQTSLTTGSLIFVGYNASDDQTDGNSSNEKFSFVLLKDVAAGTKIYFTDYGWLTGGGFQKKWVVNPGNSAPATGSNTDGIISWTASTNVAAGTQIVIRPKYQMGANIGMVACEEAVAETIAGQSYCMDLQDQGSDQLFAYQASAPRATPTLLAGLMIQGAWSSSLTNDEFTPSRSTLPAALTANNVNAALNIYSSSFNDNFRALSIYNCQTNAGFPGAIRNAVNLTPSSATQSLPDNWLIPGAGTDCAGYLYQPISGAECYNPAIPAGFDLPINCTFTVYELKIASQPVSTTVCSYQSATFSVDARISTAPIAQDANTTYQWQSSTDNVTWTNLTNSGVYSGVTSKTLTISNTAGLDNTRYRAVASEPVEPSSVTSAAALLTVSNPPQNLALAASGPLTCVTLSVNLTASSSTGGTTYAFTGPGGPIATAPGTSVIPTSQEGAYSIVATTPQGCTASTGTTVIKDITPPANINLTASGPITCAAPSVNLVATASATGDIDYAFTGATGPIPSSGNQATVSQAGTYTVTATASSNGCSATATTSVTSDTAAPTATLTASNIISCNQPTVTLTAGTGVGYTYVFRGPGGVVPGNGNQAVVSAAGTYTVVVTGPSGCTASNTVGVTGNTTTPSVNLSASGVITCAAPTVTLTATPINGATYVFSAGANQVGSASGNTATVTSAGSYTVTATDAGGCQGSATVAVTGSSAPLSINLTASGTISCAAPTVTLTATPVSGATYVFSAGANQVGGASGNTATVTSAGTYTVTATDAGGCKGSATVAVTGSSAPLSINLTASGTLSCNVPTVTLTATSINGATYVFSAGANQVGGASGNTATVASAGSYTVTATDGGGCKGSSTVSVSAVPLPSAPNLTSQTVAQGAPNVVLTASNCAGTLKWTGPGSTSGTGSITVPTFATGSFVYSATCVVNGCGGPSTSVTVTVTPTTQLKILPPDYNCATGELTLRTTFGNGNPVQYHVNTVTNGWTNGWVGDATMVVPANSRDKVLHIKARQQVTGGNGYVQADLDFNPATYCGTGRVGVEEVTAELTVRILGNPVHGGKLDVEITGAEGQPLQLELTTVAGKKVSRVHVEQATQTERQTLSMGAQPAGLLLLQVNTPTQKKTVKVLKGD